MQSEKTYIILKAQQGDRKAMRLLYEEYFQYVLEYAHRYLMNYDESKDVTQDIFLRVFEKLNLYKAEGEFGAWLNLVCRNHIISYLRSRKKRKFEVFNEQDNYERKEDEDLEENELAVFRKNLSVEELYGLLALLDEKSRTIFNLYVIEDLSHKQIASQFGMSEGTSKSQLSRARSKLKSLLMDKLKMKQKEGSKVMQIAGALILAWLSFVTMMCAAYPATLFNTIYHTLK